MRFKFCGLKISHNHRPSPAPVTPQVLIDERQQILEAQRKLNEERARQINQLKATAKSSFENTCSAIETTSQKDLKSILELNKIIKQKENEEQEYKLKIEQIESLLNRIANGEMALIDTLLSNELFLDLFADFDFETFASEAGNIELFERVSNDAFKKNFHEIIEARIAKKRKEGEDRINSNLAPQYVEIASRPFQERFAGLYAYFIHRDQEYVENGKEPWNLSIESIKKILSDIESCKKPIERNGPLERVFLDNDNLSRIAQMVMNQYLGDKIPDPNKDSVELIKAYSLALVAIVFAERTTASFLPPMCVSKDTRQPTISLLHQRYLDQEVLFLSFKSILFAGIVRILHEKGNYGDNIKSLVEDARRKFFAPFIIFSLENVFKLATAPKNLSEEDLEGLKAWILVRNDWIAILRQYSYITMSGQYPVADARIFAEALEKWGSIKRVCVVNNHHRSRSHGEFRIGSVFYHACTKQGFGEELHESFVKETIDKFKRKEIDNNTRFGFVVKSQYFADILTQVWDYYDLDIQYFDKALAIASVAALHPYKSNLMVHEIKDILFASLNSGLMRVLYRFNPEEDDSVLFKRANKIVFPFIQKFYKLYKFSRIPAQRRRDKKLQKLFCLNSVSVEIADLMYTYDLLLDTKEHRIADPTRPYAEPPVLFQAEELRKLIDERESSHLANTPLRDLPSVTVSRAHSISFADKWKGWFGTPGELVAESNSSESPYHTNRKDFSQRLDAALKPELKAAIETQTLLKTNLSLLPKGEPYSADLPGVGLAFNSSDKIVLKHSGVNIVELRPRVYDGQTPLLSKAVYICNKPFIKSNLSNYYPCGRQTLEFIEPISGAFSIQYFDLDQKPIGKPTSYKFNNQDKIDFDLEQPGGFEFTVQLQEDHSFIQSHKAEAYQKSKLDWANPILSARHKEGALDFSLNNETFVRLHNNGALELSKKQNGSQFQSLQYSIPEIDTFFQQKFNALKNQLNGSYHERILKILLVVKRLLPESQMFAPFLALAKAFDSINNPEALEKLIELLCKQFALHEVRKQHGIQKAEQYLSENEKHFPENWLEVFNRSHQASEDERLKGLFIQILQLNCQFFNATSNTIKIDQLFKLVQDLFKLASPEGLKNLDEEINNELNLEVNYLRWVTEINSVLGPDRNYQRKLQAHFKNIADEHAELHYYNQSALGDTLAKGRHDNFNQMMNIENDCLKNMSHVQSEMDRINSEYNTSSKILQDLLDKNTQAINQCHYQQQQIRNAIRKAKRKRNTKILTGIGVTILAAFTAGALAPCAASFMGITNTLVIKGMEGLIATSIRGACGQRITIQSAAFSALVPFIDSSALSIAQSFNLSGVSAQLFTTGIRNAVATSVNGGNMAKNFLIDAAFSGQTEFLEGGSTAIRATFSTGQMLTKAAATSLLYKTDFGMNLLNVLIAGAAAKAAEQGANLARLGLEAANPILQAKQNEPRVRYVKRPRQISKDGTLADVSDSSFILDSSKTQKGLSSAQETRLASLRQNSDRTERKVNAERRVNRERSSSKGAVQQTSSSPSQLNRKPNPSFFVVRLFDMTFPAAYASERDNLSKSFEQYDSELHDVSRSSSSQRSLQVPKSKPLTPQQIENRKNWPLIATMYDAYHASYEQIDGYFYKAHEFCSLLPENQVAFATDVVSLAALTPVVGRAITLGSSYMGRGAGKALEGVSWLYNRSKTLYSINRLKDHREFDPRDRIQHEMMKTIYRQKMDLKKPTHIKDPDLRRAIDRLYRTEANLGSGSTADAIRRELFTEMSTNGKFHMQKGTEYTIFIEKWLKNNPAGSPGDKAVAENVLMDLKDALGEKLWYSQTIVPK